MTPWDRQSIGDELEPIRWYSRFEIFRELGVDRSMRAAYRVWRASKGGEKRQTGSVSRPWERAAKKWKWRSRAEAWDRFQQVRRMQIEQGQIDLMNKRHLQIATDLQAAGDLSLQRLTEKFEADPDVMLKAGEIRLFLSQGIDLERTTRGLPTELIRIMGMSDEQLLKAYGVKEEDESSKSD